MPAPNNKQDDHGTGFPHEENRNPGAPRGSLPGQVQPHVGHLYGNSSNPTSHKGQNAEGSTAQSGNRNNTGIGNTNKSIPSVRKTGAPKKVN